MASASGGNITGMTMMSPQLAGKRLELLTRVVPGLVEAGGLLSLGLDPVDSYRRAATHVDKILKGAHAAELPMEQPSKLDLAVNLKTGRVLGLTIPPSVLVQATHVIE